jgi:hypothetical protein
MGWSPEDKITDARIGARGWLTTCAVIDHGVLVIAYSMTCCASRNAGRMVDDGKPHRWAGAVMSGRWFWV